MPAALAVINDWRRYRLIRNVFLALLLSVIAGCTVEMHVILFNNSQDDITLVFRNDDRKLENVVVKSHEQVKVKGLLEMSFSIRSSSTNAYAMSVGDISSFVEHVGFGPFFERIVKAQLESDGCIYLVGIKDKFPIAEKGIQPEGFPLCPKSK